jgi:hypothetical protein
VLGECVAGLGKTGVPLGVLRRTASMVCGGVVTTRLSRSTASSIGESSGSIVTLKDKCWTLVSATESCWLSIS